MAEELADQLTVKVPAILRGPAIATYNLLHGPLRMISRRHRVAFRPKSLSKPLDEDSDHDDDPLSDVHKRYESCLFTKARGLETQNIQGEEMMLGALMSVLSYTDDNGLLQVRVGTTPADEGWIDYLERKFGTPPGEYWPLSDLLAKCSLQLDTFLDYQHTGLACCFMLCNPHCPVDTQGFVAHNADNIVISFRGSEMNCSDWLTNLGVVTTSFDPEEDLEVGTDGLCCGQVSCHRSCFGDPDFPRGMVHEGWYSAFLPVIEDIEEIVTPLLAQCPKRIIICGHSLGGALATACLGWMVKTYRLAQPECKHKVLQVTVGQPRFGLKDFNEWLQEATSSMQKCGRFKVARLVRSLDLIPALPPKFLGFRHVHQKILLTTGGDILLQPDDDVVNHAELEHTHDRHHSSELATDHLLTQFLEEFETAVDGALQEKPGTTWDCMLKNLAMPAVST
eukprot:CAMPEP_0178425750 /NCGR_PEP_ID=MMETSP0689_2-20121128/28881_1 /TAXON_ID=160604 /ORGANISM="Amphidinium massartii, Strain CS-259" /LENGTH=450 /DNA_ID=CAMNT_0020047417 /DNA_START=105 /DNA_END=1457 /DNA_ORIENTATION=-